MTDIINEFVPTFVPKGHIEFCAHRGDKKRALDLQGLFVWSQQDSNL